MLELHIRHNEGEGVPMVRSAQFLGYQHFAMNKMKITNPPTYFFLYSQFIFRHEPQFGELPHIHHSGHEHNFSYQDR